MTPVSGEDRLSGEMVVARETEQVREGVVYCGSIP